jgi:uncharacterized protein
LKERLVRDPIHDFISLTEYDFIQKIIDTEYFQRLRRLFQLGVSVYVYPSATHNRLSHSLGAMELFSRIFDNLHKNDTYGSKEEFQKVVVLRKIGLATILLHDVGHGPLSHVSEKIFGFKHEDATAEIIKNTEISKILKNEGMEAEDIVKIIKHTSSPDYKYISQLVSSQLDADRLDYLSRDAYFTGVAFGKIDLERIIRTLQIYKGGGDMDGYVVSTNKGFEAIESYVLSRHLMYRGVYFHKTTRCFERLIENVFKRSVVLAKNSKLTLPKEFEFLSTNSSISINDLIQLDDHAVYYLIRQWTKSDDNILKDLANRIINRRPLKLIETENFMSYVNNLDKIKSELKSKGFDPDYYLIHDEASETPYSPYSPKGAEDETNVITNIFVLNKENEPEEISKLSKVVRTLSEPQTTFRIYLPEECKAQTLSILGLNGK